MATTLAQLAELVDGELHGEGALEIHGASPLHRARSGYITLLTHRGSLEELLDSPAAAAVVAHDQSPACPYIAVADPNAAFAKILLHFRPARIERRIGVHPGAHVSPTAEIAEDVEIYPGAVIGEECHIGPRTTIHGGVQIMAGCHIGADNVIFPNVVLYEDTILGNRVVIHSGAVVGAYGFGYEVIEGRHVRGPQLGWVEIGDEVEIGACTTIDRGVFGPTVIGEGSKFDNHVQIAHNCHVGRHTIICSQSGLAGSVTMGDYVVLAGQVGVRDHVTIGTGATVGAKSGVMADVPAGARLLGSPTNGEREQMVIFSLLPRLPEWRKQIRNLERAVERIEQAQAKPRSDAA